jgi:hypothetical protein
MGIEDGGNPPAKCFQTDEFGTPATCTSDGSGGWIVSFEDGPGFGGADAGVPAWFGVLFVLVLVAGVAGTIWKVSTARRMARESGMSQGDATAMALLTDDGFEATYLASNLRGQTGPPPTARPAASARGTASERLAELQGLRDQGLVTDEEYAAARQKILDDL